MSRDPRDGDSRDETSEAPASSLDDVPPAVLADVVSSLADKGLISIVRPSDEAEPRVVMLETIRELALEQLDAAGEARQARRLHAAHYLSLAERTRADAWGPEQAAWLRRWEADLDNLRAALDWSLGDEGDLGWGLRLAAATCRLWDMRGHLSEGHARLEALLARSPHRSGAARRPEEGQDAAATVMVGIEAAYLSFAQGAFPSARKRAEEALAPLARRAGPNAR